MAMICPQCRTPQDQRLECPRCDLPLVFEDGVPGGGEVFTTGWQHTPWGRIIIGLVLAQGIFHGLRHLTVGALMAADVIDSKELWNTLSGFILLQSLQVISLFAGALLAGAGQKQGILYGAVLGIWNGVLLVFVQPDQLLQPNAVSLYGLPLVQAFLGAVAGWIGSRIWRPITPASVPGASRQILQKVAKKQPVKWFVGPVAWFRVLLGTAIAVCGTLWASAILNKLVKVSDYQLRPGSSLESQVVIWEITGLAILTGGAFAGSAQRNGLMQGLIVGLLTACALFIIRVFSPDPPSFYLLIGSMLGPVTLGIMGGGFGSQLLPPVLVVSRRRALDSN